MNITGKYLKVWEVKEENGFKKVNLGDSRKNKDGEYDNWTWFDCTLVSSAKEVEIQKGDTIEIKNGLIAKRKYKDKYYDDVVLFDIEVMKKGTEAPKQEAPKEAQPDDLPF